MVNHNCLLIVSRLVSMTIEFFLIADLIFWAGYYSRPVSYYPKVWIVLVRWLLLISIHFFRLFHENEKSNYSGSVTHGGVVNGGKWLFRFPAWFFQVTLVVEWHCRECLSKFSGNLISVFSVFCRSAIKMIHMHSICTFASAWIHKPAANAFYDFENSRCHRILKFSKVCPNSVFLSPSLVNDSSHWLLMSFSE